MIIARNLPIFLWDEAAAYATFIRNRSPTRASKGKTPYKVWIGKKPDVSFLREFGSEFWVLDESRNRSKLEAKAKKVIFVGIMEGSKAIRYWDKDLRAIRVSRNFTFSRSGELRELQVTEVPGLGAEGEDISNTTPQTTSDNVGTTPEPPSQITPTTSTPTLHARSTLIDYSKLNNPQSWKPTTWKPITSKESKIDDQSERANLAFEQMILEHVEFSFLTKEGLKMVEEVITSEEGEQWKKAMDEEMENLRTMGTWVLQDLPDDWKTIGCKWVFIQKRDDDGNIIQHKARLVAQGFSQKPGTDYDNDGTFAPVMRFKTLRTVLAHAAIKKLHLQQFDVKGAYLNGYLNENIYMRQPPGYEDGSGRVCLLKQSLYGLKQAGNVWNQELN